MQILPYGRWKKNYYKIWVNSIIVAQSLFACEIFLPGYYEMINTIEKIILIFSIIFILLLYWASVRSGCPLFFRDVFFFGGFENRF